MAKQFASERLIDAVRALGLDPNYIQSLTLSVNNNVGPPKLTVVMWIDADGAAKLLESIGSDEITVEKVSTMDGARLREGLVPA